MKVLVPYWNLGNICYAYTLQAFSCIREQEKLEKLVTGLIWVASMHCFMEKSVNCNWAFGMVLERQTGKPSLKKCAVSPSATPGLAQPNKCAHGPDHL